MTVQVFCYPEDALLTGPAALCELAAGIGADAIAVAVRYHPARRWFARHRVVRHSRPGITYLRPADGRYARLRPITVAGDAEITAVRELRDEAARHGLAFHAWTVLLHDDPVVAAHPDTAARTLDGSPTVHALCPSHPDVVEYAAALVEDVCRQLSPDLVELEAALYPAWDPSYVISLELAPLTGTARALAGQCFCAACVRLMEELGNDPAELQRQARDQIVPAALLAARAEGAARVVAATAAAAHEHGAAVRPLIFDDPAMAALQGAAPATFEAADAVGIGCDVQSGTALADRFGGLAALAGDHPLLASLNWAPGRTGDRFAADVRTVMAAGASDIALYNLSLVPESALDDLAAAARAAARPSPDRTASCAERPVDSTTGPRMSQGEASPQVKEFSQMMTTRPGFHLAIPVDDLGRARMFYGSVLGLAEGRSSSSWVDWNFYGHQVVTHVVAAPGSGNTNPVDGHDVPVPHFGLILSIEEFHALATRLRAAGTEFVIEPYLRFAGEPGEQWTMFLRDPAGNALEFKAFRDEAQLFAT